jgi:uncharacterized protein YgbK (DUF1537 family)
MSRPNRKTLLGHPVRREMLLALKSGNFGDPELFSDALELMR